MPDPVTAVGVGGSVLGGILGGNASKDAAETSANASLAGVDENKRQFNTVLGLQAPAINTGNAARSILASILGITTPEQTFSIGQNGSIIPPSSRATIPATPDRATASRLFSTRTNAAAQPQTPMFTFTSPASNAMSPDDLQARLEAMPGYQFAVDQATKSAQALGSATGSLGGNVVSALGERVGGGIATPVFQDYLNRLTSLSGGAQTASNTASNAAISTGGMIANGLSNAGDARASGIIGSTGSYLGGLQGILEAIGRNQGGTVPYNPYGYNGGP